MRALMHGAAIALCVMLMQARTVSAQGAAAVGSIVTVPGAQLVDGESFTLNDGAGVTITFEFDSNGSVSPGHVAIPISTLDSAVTIKNKIVTAINLSVIAITAADGGTATVLLANDKVGSAGNVPILEDVLAAGFMVSGMAGGVDPPSLDVDLSKTATQYDALTDGLLIVRYVLGVTNGALTQGALGATATRIAAQDIVSYLDSIRSALDADGDGFVDITDGILILRYLFGLRGDAMIAGVVFRQEATRKTADAIGTYIQTLMP